MHGAWGGRDVDARLRVVDVVDVDNVCSAGAVSGGAVTVRGDSIVSASAIVLFLTVVLMLGVVMGRLADPELVDGFFE